MVILAPQSHFQIIPWKVLFTKNLFYKVLFWEIFRFFCCQFSQSPLFFFFIKSIYVGCTIYCVFHSLQYSGVSQRLNFSLVQSSEPLTYCSVSFWISNRQLRLNNPQTEFIIFLKHFRTILSKCHYRELSPLCMNYSSFSCSNFFYTSRLITSESLIFFSLNFLLPPHLWSLPWNNASLLTVSHLQCSLI